MLIRMIGVDERFTGTPCCEIELGLRRGCTSVWALMSRSVYGATQSRNYWSEEPSWFKGLRLFGRSRAHLTFTPVQVRVVICWHVLTWVSCFGSAGHRKSVGEDAHAKGANETEKMRRVLDFTASC